MPRTLGHLTAPGWPDPLLRKGIRSVSTCYLDNSGYCNWCLGWSRTDGQTARGNGRPALPSSQRRTDRDDRYELSAVRDGKGTDAYDLVTETIIKALEDGTVPWRKPWTTAGNFPLDLSTRKPYRGINVLLLGLAGTQYTSPWWGTYKKIHEMGGQVRKGERSTVVTFWKKLRVPRRSTARSG